MVGTLLSVRRRCSPTGAFMTAALQSLEKGDEVWKSLTGDALFFGTVILGLLIHAVLVVTVTTMVTRDRDTLRFFRAMTCPLSGAFAVSSRWT